MRCKHQLFQQARALRMKFNCGDCGGRVLNGYREGLATRSGAAVENARSVTHECGDELRGFVLNDDLAGAECLRSCDVSCLDAASGRQQTTGGENDSFPLELFFCSGRAESDCSGRDLLI